MVSAIVGHFVDAIAITTIVAINAVVGFAQEFRAERAVTALRAMTAPRGERDPGRRRAGPARGGDRRGRRAPARARRRGGCRFTPRRSPRARPRRGDPHRREPPPSTRRSAAAPPESILAERFGDVFLGTSVASGTGRAIVEHTAKDSEIGAHRIGARGPRVEHHPAARATREARKGHRRRVRGARGHRRPRGDAAGLCLARRAAHLGVAGSGPPCPRGCPPSSRSPSPSACTGWVNAACSSGASPRSRPSDRRR